jgi:hypothetical protein
VGQLALQRADVVGARPEVELAAQDEGRRAGVAGLPQGGVPPARTWLSRSGPLGTRALGGVRWSAVGSLAIVVEVYAAATCGSRQLALSSTGMLASHGRSRLAASGRGRR